MSPLSPTTRRHWIATTSAALFGAGFARHAMSAPDESGAKRQIVDIHQHTNYSGRTDDELIAHQRKMGVTQTVLLPAGRFFGLDAQCGTNETL